MTERERLIREVEAIDRAREHRLAAAASRAESRTRRIEPKGTKGSRRRTMKVLAVFALVAVACVAVCIFKPTVASDVTGVGRSASALRWQLVGSSIYPVRRLVRAGDAVLGVGSPGIVVESDRTLRQWNAVAIETALDVDPKAATELGPSYRAETVGRVGDVLSGISIARGGRVVVVGGFLGERGSRDSSTLYFDPGGALWSRPVTLEADFLHACAFDGERGYAVGNLGNIVVSSTSGSSWEFTPIVTNADLFDIDLARDGRAVAVGGIDDGQEQFGVVLVSDAWGAPFRGVLRSGRALRALGFLETGEGILTGDGGTVFASADGGRSWTDLSGDAVAAGPVRPDLRTAAISRDGGRLLYAAGGDRTVIFSNDGTKWQASALPAGAGTVTSLIFHSGALFALTDRAEVFRAEIGQDGNWFTR